MHKFPVLAVKFIPSFSSIVGSWDIAYSWLPLTASVHVGADFTVGKRDGAAVHGDPGCIKGGPAIDGLG